MKYIFFFLLSPFACEIDFLLLPFFFFFLVRESNQLRHFIVHSKRKSKIRGDDDDDEERWLCSLLEQMSYFVLFFSLPTLSLGWILLSDISTMFARPWLFPRLCLTLRYISTMYISCYLFLKICAIDWERERKIWSGIS